MAEDNITPDLLAALMAMHREVKTVGKGSTNDQAGYNYAAADAVIKTSRELLGKHGLGWIKTGQRILAPKLSPGEIGRQSYVGEVQISGFVFHAASSGLLNIVSEIPIVAKAAAPHDKSAAASSTFGTGYMHLGILNADREGAHAQVDDREEPPPEPLCVGDAAPIAASNTERCDKLAEFDGATREQVWGWACSAAKIPKDGAGYPGPKQLYVREGLAVGEILKGALTKKGAP